MAITTKQTLSNKKFRQATLDELNLNGKVIIGGELSLTDGNQAIGKIITSNANGKFVWTQTGIPNGVATLDSNGLVPASQLPSYVDDVLEFNSFATLPAIGETGKIYVTIDTNSTYRWSGSQYIKVNDAVSTSETATKLATARNIQATGDATWQVTFDGSQNVTAALTLANTGVTPNSYGNNITIPALTIDSKGRITSVTTNTVRSATQSVSGVMSATDKTKLDGIATNANNYSHPNHTGDVTSSGDGATVITNDSVSNAKLANMGVNTIKGRLNSIGDPQDLTVAQVRSLLNVEDGANNYTHPNHTGDVTSSGDGATTISNNAVTETKISNNAVTNTKLADMGANLIKGRISTAGDPQDLTAIQVRSILNIENGANNYSHPNHTGDVTSSGDGATVIANDVVTNTKLANMNANLIKGRITTDGDPQDLTPTQVRSLLNIADGANNYTHPNHTGDVTSSGDGATTISNNAVTETKISNNAVTNTKLADMGANLIKGRITTSGDPQDLTVAQVRTLLNIADGANNYTHPNHTGDVTSSGDGATTISNNAVTNTKLADMNANLIKGRITTNGDPQDLTATQVRTILNIENGANNYSHPNHTGDVTSSGDGATVISNDSVSNAKLANMGASTIKGRLSTAGDPQDLTVTQVRTLLNVADGANNYTHPNHTGDVTSNGDGATVISNNSVSNTKLADMGASTIKGRLNTTGDPQDLTVTQVKTLLSLKSISEKNYWYGAQATYDAIPTKDANTIYFIPEP